MSLLSQRRRNTSWLFVALAALLTLVPTASTQAAGSSGEVWVATISVNDYPKLPANKQLRFCMDDEEMFVSRLREGNRTSLDHLCRFRRNGQGWLVPTKENIERELPDFLSKARSDDFVIIFLSMHGSLIKQVNGENATYLLPENADPTNLPETSIPLSWLRDLLKTQVKAKRIMVIMDACHSGGIRPEEGASESLVMPTTRDIRVTFQETQQGDSDRSIYVLTSCDTNEISLETPDTNHGLFTHWLICGMDGAADWNEDGVVSMDELFGFVCDMVPRSAEYYSQATGKSVSQRPQRILLGANHSDIPLLSLSPQTPDTAFQRIAVGIDSLVRHSLVRIQARPARQPLIMLAELSPEQKTSSPVPEFGSFPQISRRKIEDSLLHRVAQLPPQFTYGIADARALELKNRDIALVDLQQGRIQNGELDAIVFGTFRREGVPGSAKDPDRLCIVIKVRQTGNGALIGQLRTTIPVNRQFLSMFGGSCDQRFPRQEMIQPVEEPHRLDDAISATPILASHTPEEFLMEQQDLHEASSGDHPFFHPNESTLSVRLFQKGPHEQYRWTSWSPRDPNNPNVLSFATRKNNQIKLELTNQTDEPLAVVVQIDGVNQIGRNVAEPSRSCYWSVQPRGRFWVDQWMDRPDIKPEENTFTVAGGHLIVSAPPESVAGRQKVTENPGEIRIVVFGMKTVPPGTRGSLPASRLGIAESPDRLTRKYPVDNSRVIDPSRPKATYVIRYFDHPGVQPLVSQNVFESGRP